MIFNYKNLTQTAELKENFSLLPSDPLVTIRCITYNHAAFITDAIEGFLMQETDFPFEILIHDDASTDGTAEIVRKYQTQHPDLIRVIYQTENQYSKGLRPWRNLLYEMARGKYIALCEGDDYWTDPHKLQKQVDFMETHPECSICCHKVKCESTNTQKRYDFLPGFKEDMILDSASIYLRQFIPTCSAVFRNQRFDRYFDETKDLKIGDWPLFVYLAQKGKIAYSNEVSGVYRFHDQGIWSNRSSIDRLLVNIDVIGFFQSSPLIQRKKEIYLALCSNYLKIIRYHYSQGQRAETNKYFRKAFSLFFKMNNAFRREVITTFLAINTPRLHKLLQKMKNSFRIPLL